MCYHIIIGVALSTVFTLEKVKNTAKTDNF